MNSITGDNLGLNILIWNLYEEAEAVANEPKDLCSHEYRTCLFPFIRLKSAMSFAETLKKPAYINLVEVLAGITECKTSA